MNIDKYNAIKDYAFNCLCNDIFECSHVERVLNYGLILLKHENDAKADVVISACLLHDIGKLSPDDMPHSQKGSNMARDYLISIGYDNNFANEVANCIASHSYKKKNPPQSLEAKILFDADKLDMYGSMGVVRAIAYTDNEAIYNKTLNLPISPEKDKGISLYSEYYNKLKNIPKRLYTTKAKDIANKLSKNMDSFFCSLVSETEYNYKKAKDIFDSYIK